MDLEEGSHARTSSSFYLLAENSDLTALSAKGPVLPEHSLGVMDGNHTLISERVNTLTKQSV